MFFDAFNLGSFCFFGKVTQICRMAVLGTEDHSSQSQMVNDPNHCTNETTASLSIDSYETEVQQIVISEVRFFFFGLDFRFSIYSSS